MINYLQEQPRTQALANALRGTAAQDSGTQMTPVQTSFVSSPSIQEPNFNQYGSGNGSGTDGLGKIAKKGFDMFKQSDTGKNMMGSISDLFYGPSTVNGASQVYGPEVAKMGGTVTAPSGGGWMDSISGMFGGGGGGNGMGGAGMSAGYGILDNLFGDKFYGKQKGDYDKPGHEKSAAAKSALTSAAYTNPWSAAALWADRLLLDGKGMDALTGWLD